MSRSLTSLLALSLSVAFSVQVGYAQEPPATPPAAAAAGQDKDAKPAEKKEKTEDEKKAEEYEKAIKDLKKYEGAFTFYQKKKELLLELPDTQLGKVFLIQATMGSGLSSMLQAGEPISYGAVAAFRWEKNDDSVWLIRPNISHRWNKKDPLDLAITRSYPEAWLSQFKVEQTHPAKKLNLVNVTNLFYGDVFRLSESVNMALGGQYGLDREKSGPEAVKAFPENSVVNMRLHFFSPRGAEGNPLLELLGLSMPNQLEDSRSAPVKLTYNMWYRAERDYQPRLADPRVGYFTEDFFNFDKFEKTDRTDRYIYRFGLKKKDPTAAMSEPVKPIVWTIDPSVPPAYREAVRKGILFWNKAFEKLGYKDAVRVQDAPKDDPNYDHADGRYNVIRWTMTDGEPYAVAQARTDPYTGEVLNAAVTFDANMTAFAGEEHKSYAIPGASATARAFDVLTLDPKRTETDDRYLWATDQERARDIVSRQMPSSWAAMRCAYPAGLAQSASFGWAALCAGGLRIDKDSYVNEFITDVVSHEVGHCLGLRHNFVASANLTASELADPAVTSEKGIAASVMDYTPVNIMAVLKGSGNFYAPTIGDYDKWAIRYGYSDSNAMTPEGEKPMLARIAAESGLPGHAFMTDENADWWDPYVVRFDSAKNPLDYNEAMLTAARRIRDYAIKNLPRSGEDYSKRTQMLLTSLSSTFREGRLAARFVGGVSGSRNFRSDLQERRTLKPVDSDIQRRAVKMIAKHCLSADAFNLPESVLTSLSFDPNDSSSAGWTAPIRDIVSRQQIMLYSQLMSASTTSRIAENTFKLAGKNGAYALDEHFSTLLGATFSEIGADKPVGAVRRDLQRFAISALITQAGASPMSVNEDVRMLASDSLRRLSARMGAQLANGSQLDPMTRIHLRDSRELIERFMSRTVAVPR